MLVNPIFLFSGMLLASMPENLPENLNVPADQRLLLQVSATGVQVYVCQPTAENPDQFGWTLKMPEAELFDSAGRSIGRHYGGPTWALEDGSQIVGQVVERSPAPEGNSIPWLLLEVESHEGEGQLTQINWIQRTNTLGGIAPESGCDGTQQNQEVRVRYSADYYFYGSP